MSAPRGGAHADGRGRRPRAQRAGAFPAFERRTTMGTVVIIAGALIVIAAAGTSLVIGLTQLLSR